MGRLALIMGVLLVLLQNSWAEVDIPEPLQPWQQWVLHNHPDIACPMLQGGGGRQCVWPRQLQLDLNEQGGQFDLQVNTFIDGWAMLPGGSEAWPTQVSNFSQPLPVVERDGLPTVYLPAGEHRLKGRLSWSQMPRTLTVPENIGLLLLSIQQQRVSSPTFAKPGQLWLRQAPSVTKKASQDSLDLKVFRRLQDGNPALVETRLQLRVSGKERELKTGPLLLPGLQARQFESALPARIEKDGSLRIQLKAGVWALNLVAHSQQPLNELKYQPHDDAWPQQEIWVFEAAPDLRTVQLSGLNSIDPSQTQLPQEWQHLPAYLAEPNATLVLQPLHRGDPKPANDKLNVHKKLWLDFSGTGYTVQDEIESQNFRGQRLNTQDKYRLARAELSGQPQLITQLPGSDTRGIELRSPQLNLTTLSRMDKQTALPVSGWKAEFEQVNSELNLPPGWSLLHGSGADKVSGSWLAAWSLWDIFLVLLIAVALGRVVHPAAGILALLTLVLIYQRSGVPVLSWLNLAVGLALLPYAKERFLTWLQCYLWLSVTIVVLLMLPFAVQEARQGVFLQLQTNTGANYPQVPQAVNPQQAQEIQPEQRYMASKKSQVRAEMDSSIEEVVVTGIRASSPQQPLYDPDQKIQAGPGLPQWQWETAYLSWSGPVTEQEQMRLYLASPLWNRLGHALAILLPLCLLYVLFLRFTHIGGWSQWRELRQRFNRASNTGVFSILLIGFCMLSVQPTPATADVLIDAELLKTLEQRLLEPPACTPQCSAIESVNVSLIGEQLSIVMQVHVAADLAFPLPTRAGQWLPQQVKVDGQPGSWLASNQQRLLVRLSTGTHQISLQGFVTNNDQLDLDFAVPLHNVTLNVQEWSVNGMPTPQGGSQSLQLRREQTRVNASEQTRLLPDPLPSYVQIHRSLDLGLDWSVTTTVTRIAPASGRIHLAVPLLPGEALTSTGVVDDNGALQVDLEAEQSQLVWHSTLKKADSLTLVAPEQTRWAELWSIQAAPIWHLQISGIEPLAQSNNRQRLWRPWPGESVAFKVQRPQAVSGRQVSIDAVNVTQDIGKRAQNLSANLTLRATQGGDYIFHLPEAAQLQRVLINGRETPVSQSQQQLKIPLKPGEQNVQVDWQSEQGVDAHTVTPALDLGLPSNNIRLTMNLPNDRWLLWVAGPALGPAMLFWGVLLVVLLLAVALARSGYTPLKAYEWILLSLGVATFNLYVLALVAVWFLIVNWRGKRSTTATQPVQFNLLQLSLFGLSVFTLLSLISAVPASLLSRPDMMVVGNGSNVSHLHWYHDQSDGSLPQAWALSLPIWVYRIGMLLWSLWLAFALMRWIPWVWHKLGVQGYWLKVEKEAAKKQLSSTSQPPPKE